MAPFFSFHPNFTDIKPWWVWALTYEGVCRKGCLSHGLMKRAYPVMVNFLCPWRWKLSKEQEEYSIEISRLIGYVGTFSLSHLTSWPLCCRPQSWDHAHGAEPVEWGLSSTLFHDKCNVLHSPVEKVSLCWFHIWLSKAKPKCPEPVLKLSPCWPQYLWKASMMYQHGLYLTTLSTSLKCEHWT